MHKRISIRINEQVYNEAKALGINVSKASENNLKILIEAIKNSHSNSEAGRVGFEPTTSSLEETAQSWIKFREWLKKKNLNPKYESTLFNYAQAYSDCLFKRDLSRVAELSDSLRPNILKALAALAKFSGRYDDWKGLVTSYGLTWVGRSKDDVFIDRLNKVENPGEVWEWVKRVKEACPELRFFMDLMAVSGLRLVEAVNSFNLILSLNEEEKLGSYYMVDKQTLEHFHFKEIFIRHSKKAFISFVPKILITSICDCEAVPKADAIQQILWRKKIKARFGDIREAHATLMVKHLKESEINFLHGRVTTSIFMANYFNPALIVDLQARAMQGVKETQELIR